MGVDHNGTPQANTYMGRNMWGGGQRETAARVGGGGCGEEEGRGVCVEEGWVEDGAVCVSVDHPTLRESGRRWLWGGGGGARGVCVCGGGLGGGRRGVRER
jgi:hypothetical protein